MFNKADPIVVGVDVVEGKLKVGTPLCVILPADKAAPGGAAGGAGDSGEVVIRTGPTILEIGRVASIEHNHVAVEFAEAGGPSVAVKIAADEGRPRFAYGRHFDFHLPLYSRITRTSIDLLKEHFKPEMTKENWRTVIRLKELLGVD